MSSKKFLLPLLAAILMLSSANAQPRIGNETDKQKQ